MSQRRAAEVDEANDVRRNKNGVKLRGTGVVPGGGNLRKSYDPDFHPRQGYEFALLGFDNEKIAEMFGISRNTFQEWERDYPDFASRLNAGRGPADAAVAVALHQKARGYKHRVTKTFFNAKTGEVVEHEVEEAFAPDTGAGIFWLYNRQRHLWKNRVDQSLTDADGKPLKPPSIEIVAAVTPTKQKKERGS